MRGGSSRGDLIDRMLSWRIVEEIKGLLTHNQLAAVESEPCLARVRVGKVSPMRIQIPANKHI